MELTENAEAILRYITNRIKTGKIRSEDPRTYIGYGEIHDYLGLQVKGRTIGESLANQGLGDLAVWARDNGFPAVTGLVVNMTSGDKQYLPGEGYFEVNGREKDDMRWWVDQVKKTLRFSWDQFLAPQPNDDGVPTLRTEPQRTPRPADFEEPSAPQRISVETYRILRDTELVRRMKAEHSFRCQICGTSIELNGGLKYIEGHHIRPLGQPHNGPDIEQNIICVCPNHHVQLDYGAIPLDKRNLEQTPNHNIGDEFIQYHNNSICGKATTPKPTGNAF